MKRGEHTFQFTGLAIAAAAQAQFEYHSMRLGYWRSEQEIAIADAKSAGVTVQEIAVTGGKRAQMYVDQRIQERLSLWQQDRCPPQRCRSLPDRGRSLRHAARPRI